MLQKLAYLAGDATTFGALYGAGGQRVEKQRLRWEVLDAFAEAAQQVGVPATDDFNGGVSYFEVNQRSDGVVDSR